MDCDLGSVVKNPPANIAEGAVDPWGWEIRWKKTWQPSAGFLSGKPHRQRSLADCSPWGRRESDRTEHTAGEFCGEGWGWWCRNALLLTRAASQGRKQQNFTEDPALWLEIKKCCVWKRNAVLSTETPIYWWVILNTLSSRTMAHL